MARGDVVMTLVGNLPDWVATMVACFRQGYVVLPCTEQLRAKDLRMRLDVARPALVVADGRNEQVLRESGWTGPTIWVPGVGDWPEREPPLAAELDPEDPCLITFTSGTAGEPKAVVHAQRYLTGQHLQAEHWLDARPGELVWCTAASGWSKSARNAFIAPWIRGAAALLHDERFDPDERLAILAEEPVAVLCMAPTEYRVIAKRAAAATDAGAARPGRRRRGAQSRGPARLARGHRPLGARRLRPDRDRADHGHAAGPRRRGRARWGAHCRGSTPGSTTASSSSTRPRCPPSSAATSARRRRAGRGAPATA